MPASVPQPAWKFTPRLQNPRVGRGLLFPSLLTPSPLPSLLHPGMAPTELAQWSALWGELV